MFRSAVLTLVLIFGVLAGLAIWGRTRISMSHQPDTAPAPRLNSMPLISGSLDDSHDRTPDQITATFSIVAADPEAGECGAAVASKYPAVGEVVPYVRAGVGAFCTQHWHNPAWGPTALQLLEQGKLPEEILSELLRDDSRKEKRQLAVVDMSGRVAVRNPNGADPGGVYWGSMAGKFYSCQGNTLAGRQVIVAMAAAYEDTKGSLADRLIAALLAGDNAGGDHRGKLAAGIRVAKVDIPDLWLELQVDKSDDAIVDLCRKYRDLDHAAKGDWGNGELRQLVK